MYHHIYHLLMLIFSHIIINLIFNSIILLPITFAISYSITQVIIILPRLILLEFSLIIIEGYLLS